MKKIISFSLYNGRKKDVVNAVVNCFLAKSVYPDWICRFYVDHTTPAGIIQAIKTFDNTEVVEMPERPEMAGRPDGWKMFWRFLAASDPNVEVMISRDGDSLLSHREKACVDEWLASDKGFHILRDHCYHSQKVMGGMWGAKKGTVPDMEELVEEFLKGGTYDQGFLAEKVYPKVIESNNAFVHYDKNQVMNNRMPSNGYFPDGGVHFPEYTHIDSPVEGVSLSEYNSLNLFGCAHCGRTHDFFIGGIMENIPQQTINMLASYFEKNGIDYELTSRPVPQHQPQPQPNRPSEGFNGSPLSLR
jgi:hypothetical protein